MQQIDTKGYYTWIVEIVIYYILLKDQSVTLMVCIYRKYVSKVGDRSQGRQESFLFNSYNSEV